MGMGQFIIVDSSLHGEYSVTFFESLRDSLKCYGGVGSGCVDLGAGHLFCSLKAC